VAGAVQVAVKPVEEIPIAPGATGAPGGATVPSDFPGEAISVLLQATAPPAPLALTVP